MTSTDSVPHASKARPAARPQLPGQIVLVMQGGGNLACGTGDEDHVVGR